MEAALRRAAAVAGQWLGVHYEDYPDDVVDAFSLVANSRRRAPELAMKVLLVSHGYPPLGVAGVERLTAQTAGELTRARPRRGGSDPRPERAAGDA